MRTSLWANSQTTSLWTKTIQTTNPSGDSHPSSASTRRPATTGCCTRTEPGSGSRSSCTRPRRRPTLTMFKIKCHRMSIKKELMFRRRRDIRLCQPLLRRLCLRRLRSKLPRVPLVQLGPEQVTQAPHRLARRTRARPDLFRNRPINLRKRLVWVIDAELY